ncbi:MAG TPA: CHASE2 domain-containing protein, partial [bacterium]
MKFSWQEIVRIWHNRWLFGGILAIGSSIIAIVLSVTTPFENFELKTYDARFALRGEMDTEQDNIFIVAIDDQSFKGLGRKWPFSRALYAKAILNLFEAGARIIVLDIEIVEPNLDEPRQDEVLAAAVYRAQNVILAGKWVTEFVANKDIISTYVLEPIPKLLEAQVRWGLVNVDEDPDGFIRRYLLFQEKNQRYYYPLSVVTYLSLNSTNGATGNGVKNDKSHFELAALRVPKADYNSMLVNFRGPAKTFRTFSFSDILDDANFDLVEEEDTDVFEMHKAEGTFKDKVVFIGAAAEELQDNKFTPFFGYKGTKRKLPGVELHANALSTLQRGDFIRRQGWGLVLLMVLLLASVAMVLTKWLKPFRGMFAVLGLILGYFIWAFYAFINNQV